MIKNIIFDLSEVIIAGYYGIETIINQNTKVTAEDFNRVKQETITMFLETMRGLYTEEEYWQFLIDNGLNLSIEELKELIRLNFNNQVVGTMEIVQKLKNKYILILLSDHIKEWGEYIIANNRDLDIFDYKVFSFEIGKLKSDDETFGDILKTIGISPDETLFIDDSEINVLKAKDSGIEGIVFKDAKQLEKELMKREIL